mmetsp:Transcript_33557/g.57536  ORF Transcript_33557/g.57536 Transcript_33557/m.57536 type:complete len:411 (-) Transcript_33557:419-1651(-)
MAFLAAITAGVDLKATEVNDRSAVNLENAGQDALDDEHERWEYFFNSGCRTWFDLISNHTMSTTFCVLEPHEAKLIVDHWETRGRLIAAALARGEGSNPTAELDALLKETIATLGPLKERLDVAVAEECAKSDVGKAFVKLSTRSPKDSKKALARAEASYNVRLDALDQLPSENERWIMLSEEVTKSSAIVNGDEALELLLDSDRVYEDLEYALRGPPGPNAPTDGSADQHDAGASSATVPHPAGGEATRWNMELVARAWDPRLTPESEFRGIAWNGDLTCLCQYFHPLHFPGMRDRSEEVQRDIISKYNEPEVKSAVDRLGGHCIIDFAWLAPGEVIVIELNPFDGVCLGTFPASTGLFLWDDPDDKAIMMGDAPFEFRMRDHPLEPALLKTQCNQDWRTIVYPKSKEG